MFKKLTLFVILFVFLMVSFSVSAEETKVKVGDTAILSKDWISARIKNPEGIKNKTYFFHFNALCGMERGSKLTVLAIDEIDKEKLLVEYVKNGESTSSTCPSNAIFWISKKKYFEITNIVNEFEEQEKKLIKEILEKEAIRKLLKKKKDK